MAIKINFDKSHNAISPTFILANRSGHKYGVLPTTDLNITDALNDAAEVSFTVYKYNNGIEVPFWDKIKDFKLAYCKEWNLWFEISVEINDEDSLVKNVSLVSLGESELSQVNLYDIEINTEDDIARDDYEPTVFYNPDNKNASLLNRLLDKVPQYTIEHVDDSLAEIQRSFSFNKKSIYDAFQDIAEEIDCLFVFDVKSDSEGNIVRSISVYDLESYCYDCQHRGNFTDKCSECGSTNIKPGYGKDTTIFISRENLADNITYSTDVDSVKNCFKMTAGDDLMTATIASCNPNGTPYIWYISDEMRDDMSDELSSKLSEYDKVYNSYFSENEIQLDDTLVNNYNNLIDKYKAYSDKYTKISNPIKGFSSLMQAYYDTIDFYLFLNDSLMPSVNIESTTAKDQASKLDSATLSPVAVNDLSIASHETVTSAVLSAAKVIIDPRFKIVANSSTYVNNVWAGSFTITNYSDDTDTATTPNITVTINDDYEKFVKQKLDKILDKKSEEVTDIVGLFDLDIDDFKSEIKKYALTPLNTFHDSCQSCIDILIEQGIADDKSWANTTPDMYTDMYLVYRNKLSALESEIATREEEIYTIVGRKDVNGDLIENGIQNEIVAKRNEIQETLNIQKYLGDELWNELLCYRREDEYSNDNYISDGLSNAELINNALEFINVAKKEIYKSATLQHKIKSTLKNLLVMKEFSPIVDNFEIGNWMRIKVDDEVYRLRLIEYTIDFSDLENLEITFSDVKKEADGVSDVQSIIDQASNMASSYDSVSRQAGQSKKAREQLSNWVNDGLSLTNMKIVNTADNQNITYDSHGVLCREYDDITDSYDDKQLKIINRGIYMTDDAWQTAKAAIGDFTFYNPKTKQYESAYGVIADKLIGNLILGKEVGIYNENNSVTLDENGLTITSDITDGENNDNVMTIQRKYLDENGNEQTEKYMYLDENGKLCFNGSVHLGDFDSIDDMTDALNQNTSDIKNTNDALNNMTDALNQNTSDIKNTNDALNNTNTTLNKVVKTVVIEYALGDGDTESDAPTSGWSENAPQSDDPNKYMWTRVKMTFVDGSIEYSTPTCIQASIDVGGRNLIRGTQKFTTDTARVNGWQNSSSYTLSQNSDGFTSASISASGLTTNTIKSLYSSYVEASKGDQFTFSVWCMVDDVSAWDVQAPFIFEGYDSSNTRVEYTDVYVTTDGTNKPTIEAGKWFYITYTRTITNDNTTKCSVRLTLFRNGSIHFKKAKLENGNIATDWTPAPEDVDSNIDNAKSVVNGKIIYMTCSTDDETYAKVATMANRDIPFTLSVGTAIAVSFDQANTAETPTLNAEGTGDIEIRAYQNQAFTSVYNWSANSTVIFVYSGSYWLIVNPDALKQLNDFNSEIDKIKEYQDNNDTNIMNIQSEIENTADTIEKNNQAFEDYKADIGQRIDWSSDSGITITAATKNADGTTTKSDFATVIDNKSMQFKEKGNTVASISSQQLHINYADIVEGMNFSNWLFSLLSNGDLTITWNGD